MNSTIEMKLLKEDKELLQNSACRQEVTLRGMDVER